MGWMSSGWRQTDGGAGDEGGPREYAYELEELEEMLRQAGFREIRQYGDLKMRRPKPGEGRVFFTARKDL